MEHCCYPFVNLPLPYADNALVPFIDAETMRLHHDRHLQTYVNNLNAALQAQPMLQTLTLEELIRISGHLSQKLSVPIRNNAGGVYNHRFYFAGLSPASGIADAPLLLEQIERQFGNLEQLKTALRDAALSVFGSGYTWLVSDRGRLRILTTANQDTPAAHSLSPILVIDVWEHAYYLKHRNVRAAYFDDWFSVIDWQRAQHCYLVSCTAR